MATISWVVFKHHKKKDGTFNPKIRLYHNGTTVYLPTPIFTSFVRFRRGASSGSITDGNVEDALNSRVKVMRRIINDFDFIVEECEDAKAVAAFLDRKMNQEKTLDFISFLKDSIQEMPNKGTKTVYRILLANLIQFVGSDKLPIRKLDSSFLKRFEAWLKSENRGVRGNPNLSSRSLQDSTVQLYFSAIRATYNRMLRKYNDYDKGDIVITRDPFKNYSPSLHIEYSKKAVPAEIIRRIASYVPKKGNPESRIFARDIFLLSFCLAGMNIVDIYTCETFHNGRIDYCRTKTRDKKKGHAFISVPVSPEIESLFERYRDREGTHVFNLHKRYKTMVLVRSALSYGMKALCRDLGIEPITFYAARHSFATIARNDCDVSMEDVALCLTHRSGFDMTDTYVKPDFSRVDRVIRKVLDFVFHPETTNSNK